MSPGGGDPLLLAMDTSTARGSVAVGIPGTTLGRIFLDSRSGRGSELLPAVRGTMASAGVDLEELSGIVVGAGPGSFTGVRIAAATAKGLARGLELPLWAFSSLAAGAATADALSPPAAGFDQPESELPYAGGLS
ncbi:MAG: tRNA (adenosine(37)-N6)-threonylcarbamoyltransferase complex dimerization subunit type 1 TsaB, partial [Gammaproteobacteria bacterium]|nr:tRNA (adenosine(37)-N6)-threonylcarbamoyltransferase complex dimerization subunit type 1 TsaB [Gemmatimonadota bacterium]NIU75191.1 tRNA (adenosine(37)-N6)-threonylcarbamoyltransferase complex dimerization subunit type 1 TsaB [Gammaproteobacteria bacterium]